MVLLSTEKAYLLVLLLVAAACQANSAGTAGDLVKTANLAGASLTRTAVDRVQGSLWGDVRAARTTDVFIINVSAISFKQTFIYCIHGSYSEGLRPEFELKAMSSTVFGIESNEFLTGVECETTYTSTDGSGSFITIIIANPYIGSSFATTKSSPNLRIIDVLPQGHNNQATFTVSPKIA